MDETIEKGAYSVDFEKFDDPNFNPFESKKAMQNSPPSSPPPPKGAYSMDFDKFDDPNFNPFATKKAMQNSPPATPVEKMEIDSKPEVPVVSNVEVPAEPKIPVEPVEKSKPETSGKLPVEPTVSSEAQEMKAKTDSVGEPDQPVETEPPPPKGAYTVDFDKFDDPNFNPFATKKSMQNSPPGSPAPKVEEKKVEHQVKNY